MVESMLSASLDSRSATTYRSGPSAGAAIGSPPGKEMSEEPGIR